MRTVPEKFTRNNDLVVDWTAAERELAQAQKWLRRAADRMLPAAASFAERERVLLSASNEACRRDIAAELRATSAQLRAKYLRIDGKLYQRHQDNSAWYHSLCGSMRVERATYRTVAVRNGPTVVPLELKLGLVVNATPALAYYIALGDAQCPGRHWAQLMAASIRTAPSRSTLERMAKTIGTSAKTAAPQIEPTVRSLEKLPAQAHAIALGLDRTTIPMEEPHLGSLNTQRRTRTKPYVRRKPDPIDVNYRMAYVGTVTVSDLHGEPLQTFRYSASADEGPDRVVASMMADLEHARRTRVRQRKPALNVGVTQDAAPELWMLMQDALGKLGVPQWHGVVDRYHLTERLALALQVLPIQTVDRKRRLARWRLELEQDDDAIERIERYLATQRRNYAKLCAAAHRPPVFADHRLLGDQLRYIRNHKSRMRYASARVLGLPTGSGTTEGACKSLVMIRAKGCGQRWHTRGINSVLTLRAYLMSDRLPAFWAIFSKQYSAEIQVA